MAEVVEQELEKKLTLEENGPKAEEAATTAEVVDNADGDDDDDDVVDPWNVESKSDKVYRVNQLITIDGRVMAVAFMANAQHFFYRSDVLAQADPDTDAYDALLERYPGAQIRNFDGAPGVSEMDALIAYLQMLGTTVDFSTFTPAASR